MVQAGLTDCLGGSLEGIRVLDVGSRSGRMSCLFGLLGAQVVGLDIHEEFIRAGQSEAQKFNLESRVAFRRYSGNMRDLGDEKFDLVFSKSVLVLMPDLHDTLKSIYQLLRQDGRILFIENGIGGRVQRLARWLRHRGKWDYSSVNYFSDRHVELVSSFFEIETMHHARVPPIYMLYGRKRSGILQSA